MQSCHSITGEMGFCLTVEDVPLLLYLNLYRAVNEEGMEGSSDFVNRRKGTAGLREAEEEEEREETAAKEADDNENDIWRHRGRRGFEKG